MHFTTVYYFIKAFFVATSQKRDFEQKSYITGCPKNIKKAINLLMKQMTPLQVRTRVIFIRWKMKPLSVELHCTGCGELSGSTIYYEIKSAVGEKSFHDRSLQLRLKGQLQTKTDTRPEGSASW